MLKILANADFTMMIKFKSILHQHLQKIVGIVSLILVSIINHVVHVHQPPPWKPEPTVEIESVEVRNVTLRGKTQCEEECDALVVFGYLRNNGFAPVFLPRVRVSVIDGAGNIRWTARGFPTLVNLAPGESASFQVPSYASALSELVHIEFESRRRS